ncbi:UDP-N-acetylmuramate dehydrogenase [Paludibacterium paludis]|uniref:UDP-N-acetylenolpyruvoylglucosamine reductase n=1 Tax=Paludibacterium paludis TaxID=1225769 RepID=A0A918P6J3_9NEIS|nr:UDP-N-acetylmuramate dehydrogenase [Paludibacterium paludis]GGY26528.1 UDP-N-acetylenolpyruvoylglucosamine reductase [Paludibacterium paludis]
MSCAISHSVSLKPFNTFGLDVRAEHYAELAEPADLPALLAATPAPTLWLGGGSNILFTRDVPGLVVRLALKGVRIARDDGDSVVVEAAAGENWHRFVRRTLEHGWYGLENLSLIPGTVGASPVQNIGAYGVEVKDSIEQVVCADLSAGGREVVLSNEACRFGYRDSIFKHAAGANLLVTAVRFRLAREPRTTTGYGDIAGELARMGRTNPTPLDVSDAVMRIRAAKLPDPATLGNAGSFFKNPIVANAVADDLASRFPGLVRYPAGEEHSKLAAGWLIDQAGLKGYRDGDAGVHTRQALVLVNYGRATGADIARLAGKVRNTVFERYGVALEAEPVIL